MNLDRAQVVIVEVEIIRLHLFNNNDAFNAEQARLASEQDAERRRQQDIDRYEKAAYEYQSRGLNRAAVEMNQRANNLNKLD